MTSVGWHPHFIVRHWNHLMDRNRMSMPGDDAERRCEKFSRNETVTNGGRDYHEDHLAPPQQQQHHAQDIVVGRQDSQTSPLTVTPHCSPQLDVMQFAQTVGQPPQDQAQQQQQHLQQVPQQSLFDGSPRLVAQQHAAMQHSAQQLIQQPMAMLQTPILYSNNANTGAVAAGANSPVTVKKHGRFRVVRGATNDTTTTPPLHSESITTTGGDRSEAHAPLSNNANSDANGENADISLKQHQSHSVSTVKKGRFVVKKSANVATAATASDVDKSPETVISFVGGEVESGAAVAAAADANVIERLKKMEEKRIELGGGEHIPSVLSSSSLNQATTTDVNKAPCAKRKGRFLVKTGGVPELAIAVGGGGAEIVPTDAGRPPTNAAETSVGPVILEDIASAGGDVKKKGTTTTTTKGRFVVKTGGMTVPVGGTTTNVISPSSLDEMQNVTIQNATSNQQSQSLPPATTTTNSSNVAVPPVTQVMEQQQQLQQNRSESQASIPHVLSATSSIGSSSSVTYHQKQQQTTQTQTPSNANDAQKHLPHVSHRMALSPPANTINGVSSQPGVGTSVGGWLGPAGGMRGKNGRMIGGGGVGKVLHYIDTMRTEVVEADRCIASLQSDNRFLRDKNKELEAKSKDLERRLMEEKRLRQKAEAKYASMLQQDLGIHQEILLVPRADGGSSRDDCRNSTQPIHASPSFDRIDGNTSAVTKGVQSISPDVFKDNQMQLQQNLTRTGPLEPSLPVSRFDARGVPPRLLTVALPQSTTVHSSVAKRFDPLGGVDMPIHPNGCSTMLCLGSIPNHPLANSSENSIMSEGTNASKKDIPLDLLGVPESHSKTCDSGVTAKIVFTTAESDAPPKPHADITKKHFDPLGTPKRLGRGNNGDDALPPALALDGGLPQIPDTSTHRTILIDENEDPFNEIMRMSHSHLHECG